MSPMFSSLLSCKGVLHLKGCISEWASETVCNINNIFSSPSVFILGTTVDICYWTDHDLTHPSVSGLSHCSSSYLRLTFTHSFPLSCFLFTPSIGGPVTVSTSQPFNFHSTFPPFPMRHCFLCAFQWRWSEHCTIHTLCLPPQITIDEVSQFRSITKYIQLTDFSRKFLHICPI